MPQSWGGMSESQYRFAEFQLDCASFELRREKDVPTTGNSGTDPFPQAGAGNVESFCISRSSPERSR